MTEFAIDAPPRAAAFLAQLAHESGQLRFMEEIWGPTAQQGRYEPVTSLATSLGNTQAEQQVTRPPPRDRGLAEEPVASRGRGESCRANEGAGCLRSDVPRELLAAHPKRFSV